MIIQSTTPPTKLSSQTDDIVLSVQGVSKKFCRNLKRSLLYGVQDIGSEILGLRQGCDRLRPKEFWALKDINLELRRGEALGLVGTNGSGKTTLLRLISGLIRPDTGKVKIQGRVAPLIALGAGFNPVLTGRENIYANMSILGLSTREIDAQFDAVVDFAEIGDAIDAPVHSYSSGMAARLGFACAVHTNPDILLIDEVLAVGDIQFLAKCHRRLHELRETGTAFVLVSHNPQAILSMCQQSVYLKQGNVMLVGMSELVMFKYEDDVFLGERKGTTGMVVFPSKSETESMGLDLSYLCFRDTYGKRIDTLTSGEATELCIGFLAHQQLEQVNLRISIVKEGQTFLYLGGSNDDQSFRVSSGLHELKIRLPYLGLAPGTYSMQVDIRNKTLYILDLSAPFQFAVQSNGKMSKSMFYQPRSWQLVSNINQPQL